MRRDRDSASGRSFSPKSSRFPFIYGVSQGGFAVGLAIASALLSGPECVGPVVLACLVATTAAALSWGLRLATQQRTHWPEDENFGFVLLNSVLVAGALWLLFVATWSLGAVATLVALGYIKYDTVAGALIGARTSGSLSRWRGAAMLGLAYLALAVWLPSTTAPPPAAVPVAAAAAGAVPVMGEAVQLQQLGMLSDGATGLLALAIGVLVRRAQRRIRCPEELKTVHPVSWGIAAVVLLPFVLYNIATASGPIQMPLASPVAVGQVLVLCCGVVSATLLDARLAKEKDDGGLVALHRMGFLVALAAAVAIEQPWPALGPLLVATGLTIGGSQALAGGRATSANADGSAGLLDRRDSVGVMVWRTIKQIVADPDSRKLVAFLVCTLLFMFVELVYGAWTNSLSLISDGFHMLFDCSALAIALYCTVMSKWPASRSFTFGYGRFQILSGHVNGIFLIFTAVFILFESIERLLDPPSVKTERLLFVAVIGLCVNLVGLYAFHDHHGHSHSHSHSHSHGGGDCEGDHGADDGHDDLSAQGVFLHILADALGSVGVIISSLLIQFFGWTIADPLCSVVISVLIGLSVVPLLRNSTIALMQRAPSSHGRVAARRTVERMLAIPGVVTVRYLRTWTQDEKTTVAAVAMAAAPGADLQAIRTAAHALLRSKGFARITVEVEAQAGAASALTPPLGDGATSQHLLTNGAVVAAAQPLRPATPSSAALPAGLLDSPSSLLQSPRSRDD